MTSITYLSESWFILSAWVLMVDTCLYKTSILYYCNFEVWWTLYYDTIRLYYNTVLVIILPVTKPNSVLQSVNHNNLKRLIEVLKAYCQNEQNELFWGGPVDYKANNKVDCLFNASFGDSYFNTSRGGVLSVCLQLFTLFHHLANTPFTQHYDLIYQDHADHPDLKKIIKSGHSRRQNQ